MRDRHYDALAEHKADHERLLDELRDLMDAQAEGAVLDDKRFSAQLAQWFTGHFQTHDARFHRHLNR
jgi:hemerythrin